MLTEEKVSTFDQVNLIIVDNWIVRKSSMEDSRQLIEDILREDQREFVAGYGNIQESKQSKFTPAYLKKLKNQFFDIYINSASMTKMISLINEFYSKDDYMLVQSELQKVWYSREMEHKLCLVNTRLNKTFNRMFTTIQPLEKLNFMVRRIQRLGREQEFLEQHHYFFNLLTPREKQILQLLANGLNNPGIAEKLFISRNTVEQHRKNINKKLHSHSFVELLRYAQAFCLV